MHLLEWPSPNHDARPTDGVIDMLILHYTGMTSGEAALARLTSPDAKVSAHYVVEEDGAIWHLVPEDRRAWHAGISFWAGRRDINAHSIGIELVNPGHDFGYRPFPYAQMTALIELCRGLLARHPIPRARVVGHSDVAPRRKIDPGELFDWRALAQAGFGLWPEPLEGPADPAAALKELARIGYEIGQDEADEISRAAIAAFQRHFRPQRIDGEIDSETASLIYGMARALKETDG